MSSQTIDSGSRRNVSDRPARKTRVSRFTETKNGFKTSEMLVMLVFAVGVLIATYADDDTLSHRDGWMFAAIVAAAYIISRGLAKLGVRQPYVDER